MGSCEGMERINMSHVDTRSFTPTSLGPCLSQGVNQDLASQVVSLTADFEAMQRRHERTLQQIASAERQVRYEVDP